MRLQRVQIPRRGISYRVGATCLAAVALALLGVRCPPQPLLPPFLSSTPADGETVSRSAWLVARFAGAVLEGAEERIWLACDGSVLARTTHPLAPDAVVINPRGSLPADAACWLGLVT